MQNKVFKVKSKLDFGNLSSMPKPYYLLRARCNTIYILHRSVQINSNTHSSIHEFSNKPMKITLSSWASTAFLFFVMSADINANKITKYLKNHKASHQYT